MPLDLTRGLDIASVSHPIGSFVYGLPIGNFTAEMAMTVPVIAMAMRSCEAQT